MENQHPSSCSISNRRGIIIILAGALCAAAVWFLGFRPFLVNGASMYPTFNASFEDSNDMRLIGGDYLIIDIFSYIFIHEPERLDVIVFRSPTEPGRYLLKRIIALPNEQVRLAGTTVTVTGENGEVLTLTEPYINRRDIVSYKSKTWRLGEDEYFLLGDNRARSLDSRVWGSLPKHRIVGRVIARLYPFSMIDLYT